MGSNPTASATMKIRTNPDTEVPEVQVDEDVWRPIDEVAEEASREDKTVRGYLMEHYGRVID